MDEYLNQLLSPSSWSHVDAREGSSWGCSESSQPGGSLLNSVGVYKDGNENSPTSMINSNPTVESLAAQDSSSAIIGGVSDFGLENGLPLGETRAQEDGHTCNGNTPSDGMVNGSLKFGNMGFQYDIAHGNFCSLNFGSSEQFPVIGGKTGSSLSFNELRHVESNGGEPSEFQTSLKDIQNLSPIPELWPPQQYDRVASLSAVMGQEKVQGFGLQGEYMDNNIDVMGNQYVGVDKILQLDNLSPLVTTKCTSATTPSGSCNGTGKPRVRARRGQATDPHSIAERLRREKIAERMKNLQELVPNPNKTDKASMLDEIIDYVKFLQLQVKVLSMSRLGAAGAVVPLITDRQAEDSDGLLLSPSAGQGVGISQSPDQTAFEQEVAKLMETNVTMAMQYLQSKGLCLMPIALAAAISGGKASPHGPVSEGRKKFGSADGLVHNNSSTLPGIGTTRMPSDNNIMFGKLSREGIITNSCSGAVKQEEVKST